MSQAISKYDDLSDREVTALKRLRDSDKPCAWIAERMLEIHKTD